MSKNIDINQLLDQIGTSARSASDPWTLSRSSRGSVSGSAFTPSVVADLGAPSQTLDSEIQSSQRITQADSLASSPTASSGSGGSSSGGGILGGLLNIFPLASGIAKLFGFGGSSSPPALMPYEPAPSINFEGAMSSPTSGVTSLSYGANGLPRTTAPAQPMSSVASPSAATSSSTNLLTELTSLTQSGSSQTSPVSPANPSGTFAPDNNVAGMLGQIGTGSTFDSQPAGTNPMVAADLVSQANSQTSVGSSSSTSPSGTSLGPAAPGSSPNSSSSQQGNNILVQVQAMDSQSFMDHSQDIAQAVRQAMLNMNSLNDVILDL